MTVNNDICDECKTYTDPIGDDYAKLLPTGKFLCGPCRAQKYPLDVKLEYMERERDAPRRQRAEINVEFDRLNELAAENERAFQVWRRRCLEAEAKAEALTKDNKELESACLALEYEVKRLQRELNRNAHRDDGNGCSCGRVHQDRT